MIITSRESKNLFCTVLISIMFACYGLCGHLYKCNRLDISNICKHIHKVHSLLSRNVTVDVSNKEEPLEDDYHFNYTNTTKNGQVQEIAKLKKQS